MEPGSVHGEIPTLPFGTRPPHSPTPVPILPVSGAAGAWMISPATLTGECHFIKATGGEYADAAPISDSTAGGKADHRPAGSAGIAGEETGSVTGAGMRAGCPHCFRVYVAGD